MRPFKKNSYLLVLPFVLILSTSVSATTIVSQLGVDDDVTFNAVDLISLDSPNTVSWDHNYTSGIFNITSAILEIDINAPGGVFDAPMGITFDGISLGDSSSDRTGVDILHTFDLLALGLTSLLDGMNTVELAPYTFNSFYVDFSRLTITGTTPVPEPASMILFGTGMAGLAASRLRKKNK